MGRRKSEDPPFPSLERIQELRTLLTNDGLVPGPQDLQDLLAIVIQAEVDATDALRISHEQPAQAAP
jgi:hypothetical protein